MNFLNDNGFIRKDCEVILHLDSGLGTCRPIYPFSYNFGSSQENAELLRRQMDKQLDMFKKHIANNATLYLDPYEISELKKELRQWDAKQECWK